MYTEHKSTLIHKEDTSEEKEVYLQLWRICSSLFDVLANTILVIEPHLTQ